MLSTILDILTILALLLGLFFMFIGALGIVRLPDVYHRMHAATKCITLGIAGLLTAAVLHLSNPSAAVTQTPPDATDPPVAVNEPRAGAMGAITKAVLVVIFQFVAAPVGAHMLARAAHMAKVPQWKGTVGDELTEHEAEKEVIRED